MTILIRPKSSYVRKKRAGNGDEILKKLEDFLKNNTGEPIRILSRFWQDQQNAITYKELREAVVNGKLNESTFMEWSKDYSFLLKNQLKDMFTKPINAGSYSQPLIQTLEGYTFNSQTQSVLNWIQQRGSLLVTNCASEQKEAINLLLSKAVMENKSTEEIARYIRPCIGLTKGQAQANLKYYNNIIDTLKKEHPKMKPENIEKRAREASAKYAERQHTQRAMTIAQTEMATAYNRGAYESIKQAQAQHLIGTVKKRWSTSGDDAVCTKCSSLEGVEIDMDSRFEINVRSTGEGLTPPAHPRCACAIEYIEVERPNVNYINNLSANDNNHEVTEHRPPEYLGSIDVISNDVIKSTLEKYEANIVNSDIENAIVISKSGMVWKCYGTQNQVFPNVDLGDELQGAWVTHNHPISETHYSFSGDDIYLFLNEKLVELHGIDKKYRYVVKRTSKTKYADLDTISYFFDKNYGEYLQEVMQEKIDANFDEYDYFVRRLAVVYGFEYERQEL